MKLTPEACVKCSSELHTGVVCETCLNAVHKQHLDRQFGGNSDSGSSVYHMGLLAGLGLIHQEIEISTLAQLLKKIGGRDDLSVDQVVVMIEQVQQSEYIDVELVQDWAIFNYSRDGTNEAWFQFNQMERIREVHGILTGNKQVPLSVLSKKTRRSREEILQILSLLVVSGYADIALDEMGLLHIHELHPLEDSILTRTQRLMLGYLYSSSNPSLSQLAELLDTGIAELKQVFHILISEKMVQGELTRSDGIIVDTIAEIPPTRSLQGLDWTASGILGQIVQHEVISIDPLISTWKISRSDIMIILCDLIGSGLVSLDMVGDQLRLIIDRRENNELLLGHTDDTYAQLVRNIESTCDLAELASRQGISRNELLLLLYQMVGYGIYPRGRIEDNCFHPNSVASVLPTPACTTCKQPLGPDVKRCPACGSYQDMCLICRTRVSVHRKILGCPYCLQQYHSSHIISWIEFQGSCPKCRREINKTDLREGD